MLTARPRCCATFNGQICVMPMSPVVLAFAASWPSEEGIQTAGPSPTPAWSPGNCWLLLLIKGCAPQAAPIYPDFTEDGNASADVLQTGNCEWRRWGSELSWNM